ncbi:hypothetical protein L345_07272, partial [Ophiophagus hannah]
MLTEEHFNTCKSEGQMGMLEDSDPHTAINAGIRRTGCFIATVIGCQQLREKGAVDVSSIICQLHLD